jgi:mannonate dehydratase
MKLGFGLYRHQLNSAHYKFAKQCGATHVVVHLCDYFNTDSKEQSEANQPVGDSSDGWGFAGGGNDPIWSLEGLQKLKEDIEAHGLKIWAIENFDPSMWYDILLDGPEKESQMAFLQELIRTVGKVGIPVFGYNFSIAGVASREIGPVARGGAHSVFMRKVDETPIPNGMVWNMRYSKNEPEGEIPFFSHEILWERLNWFLLNLIPAAEEANVCLAAHPDDPPMPIVRNSPRLVYQPHMYDDLLNIAPSPNNALELCLGTIAEMTSGDVYDVVDKYSKSNKIGYIHFRNVHGKVPHYDETFIDEGDIDMPRVLSILKKNNYEGVLIPDHTPQMTCDAPWHAGMAYAMGYMKAAMQLI